MARHFMGISLLGGLYNAKFKEHLYEGDIWAAGLTYGYAFVLSRHWNMEATLGIGMAKLRAFSIIGKERKNRQHPIFPNGRLSLFGWDYLSLIYLSDFN